MKLTTKSEYSLLTLIYLARNADDRLVPLDEVSKEYNIPIKYLERLANMLKQSRLVKARRGAAGGYQLARPANEITLAEIIRLMDGALAPTESVSTYFFDKTPISKEAAITEVFRDIRDYIAGKLEKITLADFI